MSWRARWMLSATAPPPATSSTSTPRSAAGATPQSSFATSPRADKCTPRQLRAETTARRDGLCVCGCSSCGDPGPVPAMRPALAEGLVLTAVVPAGVGLVAVHGVLSCDIQHPGAYPLAARVVLAREVPHIDEHSVRDAIGLVAGAEQAGCGVPHMRGQHVVQSLECDPVAGYRPPDVLVEQVAPGGPWWASAAATRWRPALGTSRMDNVAPNGHAVSV